MSLMKSLKSGFDSLCHLSIDFLVQQLWDQILGVCSQSTISDLNDVKLGT